MARENSDLKMDEDEAEDGTIAQNDPDDGVPGSNDDAASSSESKDTLDEDLLQATEQVSLQPIAYVVPDLVPIVEPHGNLSSLTSPDSGKPSLSETAPEASAEGLSKREKRRVKEAAKKARGAAATANTIEVLHCLTTTRVFANNAESGVTHVVKNSPAARNSSHISPKRGTLSPSLKRANQDTWGRKGFCSRIMKATRETGRKVAK